MNTDATIGRRRSLGSGVVIDSGGYVITNAHVVENATRVQVVVPGRAYTTAADARIERGQAVDATVVGVAPEIDMALLKVKAVAVPALRFEMF